MPGVNITQSSGAAGAGANITIRGGNSTSEGRENQPLFVVDGIIYDNSTTVVGNSGTDGMTRSNTTYSNRVMDINPEDIESMSVLKGAAAAALYGSRAADGVVIITTKKGEEGAVKVDFSSKFSTSWATKLPEAQTQFGRGWYSENGVMTDITYQSWGEKLVLMFLFMITSVIFSRTVRFGIIVLVYRVVTRMDLSICQHPIILKTVLFPQQVMTRLLSVLTQSRNMVS